MIWLVYRYSDDEVVGYIEGWIGLWLFLWSGPDTLYVKPFRGMRTTN